MLCETGIKQFDDTHALFWPDMWRAVLNCFADMEAVNVDYKFGSTQIHWIIQDKISSIPTSHSWLLAAKNRSLGMLIYLMNYRIPCPFIEDIIQYAISKNHLETLVFFTRKEFTFYGIDGNPMKESTFCPVIDGAIRRNYVNVVQYTLWRYKDVKNKLIKKPVELLSHLLQHNLFHIFQALVPSLMKVVNFDGLNLACGKGYCSLVDYALKHLDTDYTGTELPDDLLVSAAKNGHLDVLKLLKRRKPENYIPLRAYQQAFSWGHVNVCTYIQKRFPSYMPSTKDLIDACVHGHHQVIELLPKTYSVLPECIEKAVHGNNPKLVYVLRDKLGPSFKFTRKLLKEAFQSKNSDVLIAVFDCGQYKKLPKDAETLLVRNRMRKALTLFHRVGFPVYSEAALLEAARICDLDILKDVLGQQGDQGQQHDSESQRKPLFSESVGQTALNYIYVSSESKEKRADAYTYVNNYFNHKSKHDRPPMNDVLLSKRQKHI